MVRAALTFATVCVRLSWLVRLAIAGDVHVSAGQSIQAAINAAQQGDKIIVGAGSYAEQLTINKDSISLVGHGAILVPPAVPGQNLCSGLAGNDTEAGICIEGADVVLAPYVAEHRKVTSVGHPVVGVSVAGFQVNGFSGENIAAVGAQDVHITDNWLYDGGQPGFLADGSKGTRFVNNAVVSSGQIRFIAICTDDEADVQVLNNRISGYGVGLCIQTPESILQYNDISSCCVGAFIDPRVDGAKLRHNYIGATNPSCVTDWPFSSGVFVDGAINSQVQFNVIEGQSAGGTASGIGLVDEATVDPIAVASGNVITLNTLRNNDLDLYVNTTGTGNVVAENICSTPAELCA